MSETERNSIATPARPADYGFNNKLVTPERAAFLRQRLRAKLAARWAAITGFDAMCARPATEPQSSFGKFTHTFEEIGLSLSAAFDRESHPSNNECPSKSADVQQRLFRIFSVRKTSSGEELAQAFEIIGAPKGNRTHVFAVKEG